MLTCAYIHADVDEPGWADVGHGAKVRDLVDGAHQLEVGDRGHVQLAAAGKIGDYILKSQKTM